MTEADSGSGSPSRVRVAWTVLVALSNQAARNGFLQQLEEAANRELLELALRNVQSRVETQTWEAFRLTQFDVMTPQEVAVNLDIKLGSVYVARTRVRQLLMDELEALDTDTER